MAYKINASPTDTVTVSRQFFRSVMRQKAKAERVTPAEAARRRIAAAKAACRQAYADAIKP